MEGVAGALESFCPSPKLADQPAGGPFFSYQGCHEHSGSRAGDWPAQMLKDIWFMTIVSPIRLSNMVLGQTEPPGLCGDCQVGAYTRAWADEVTGHESGKGLSCPSHLTDG